MHLLIDFLNNDVIVHLSESGFFTTIQFIFTTENSLQKERKICEETNPIEEENEKLAVKKSDSYQRRVGTYEKGNH